MASALTQDVVPLSPTGTIASVARKEDPYDTEGQNDATASVTLNFFQNYTTFGTSNLSLTKNNPRDCNLSGGQAGLPNGYRHHIYKWAACDFTYNNNLNTAANVVSFEEINRGIELTICIMRFEADWITVKKCDLVWSDRVVQTTFNAATVIALPHIGLDPKGKDVTVRGKPKTLNANSPFRIQEQTPTTYTPTVEHFHTHWLRGVLQRGIG